MENIVYEGISRQKPIELSRMPDLTVKPGDDTPEAKETAEKLSGIFNSDTKKRANRKLLGLAIKHADQVISISIKGKSNKQEIESHKNIQKALKASGKKVKYFTISDESDEDWQNLNLELETFFGVEY